MSATSSSDPSSAFLGLFGKSSDGRLTAGEIKKKGKVGVDGGLDASEADRRISELIEQGLVAVTGGSKEGHHPRPNASYRLTEQGKHHVRPTRPDFPDEVLRYQESFILLQVFRAKERKLTRSELNAKLKTVAAIRQLDFDVKGAPETVSYHLAMLVEKGCLDEQRRGNSTSYTLNPEKGVESLAAAEQHTQATFSMDGKTLNALLEAARGSGASPGVDHEPIDEEVSPPAPVSRSSAVGEEDIAKYIEVLLADKYAGKGLIPIHEVRSLVAEHHGTEAAVHAVFDPLLKRMRGEGHLELIAISDKRGATPEQLEASIPGVNETIFYVVVE